MPPVKVLNVAEKPSAARSIAEVMHGGRPVTREGFSQYNKVFDFPYMVQVRAAAVVDEHDGGGDDGDHDGGAGAGGGHADDLGERPPAQHGVRAGVQEMVGGYTCRSLVI